MIQSSHGVTYYLFAEGWSSPTVTGSPPPPCRGFSFTKISEEEVVMIGGTSPVLDEQRLNYIYKLNCHKLVSPISVSPYSLSQFIQSYHIGMDCYIKT